MNKGKLLTLRPLTDAERKIVRGATPHYKGAVPPKPRPFLKLAQLHPLTLRQS